MKPLAALAALLVAVAGTAVPAFARDSFVIDNAHLLSAATISQINAKVSDFNAQTHKEVVVDTEPAVTGGTAQQMAESIYAQQQINGVLIFIAQSPKTIGVLPGRTESAFFPSGSAAAIRQAIANGFNSGDFNGGVNNGVDLTLSIYRSHLGSLRSTNATAPVAVPVERAQTAGGPHISMIVLWLIALAVIFFIVRGIFRAMSRPRMMGPMGGPGGYPPGGGGYGPGYGPGYGGPGMGGGGGGFFSGLLGGLGGAFLGNELFGNRGGNETIVQQDPNSTYAGMGPGNADASGWQNDAGQADPGNSSFGGWGGGGGDSGGGWGGGGDSGGGWGGGDSGGGGGDSGGGGGGW